MTEVRNPLAVIPDVKVGESARTIAPVPVVPSDRFAAAGWDRDTTPAAVMETTHSLVTGAPPVMENDDPPPAAAGYPAFIISVPNVRYGDDFRRRG